MTEKNKKSRTSKVGNKRKISLQNRITCYHLSLVLLFLALAAAIYLQFIPVSLNGGRGCLLYTATGLYCPGCGGTRAVFALLLGHPLLCLYFHPLVFYTAALFAIYLVTNTIEYLSKSRFEIGLHYHNWFAWCALAIVSLNCLIRNILNIIFQIPLGL